MGKDAIKKSEGAGEVGVVESIGVRTRAKTQGLLHHNSAPPPGGGGGEGSSSYLQLRNRRLQKPPNFSCHTKRKPTSTSTIIIANTSKPTARATVSRKSTSASNSKSKLVIGSTNSFDCLGSIQSQQSKLERVREPEAAHQERNINLHVEAEAAPPSSSSSSSSLGETVLEFQGCTARFSDRRTLDSTPSSSNSSSTRRRSRLIMPTSDEMDRFFLGPEQQQQIQFIQKYNFDPVNDKPLPGRFEWKKLHPK